MNSSSNNKPTLSWCALSHLKLKLGTMTKIYNFSVCHSVEITEIYSSQCGNFGIFLWLRFYVKSILENLEALNIYSNIIFDKSFVKATFFTKGIANFPNFWSHKLWPFILSPNFFFYHTFCSEKTGHSRRHEIELNTNLSAYAWAKHSVEIPEIYSHTCLKPV